MAVSFQGISTLVLQLGRMRHLGNSWYPLWLSTNFRETSGCTADGGMTVRHCDVAEGQDWLHWVTGSRTLIHEKLLVSADCSFIGVEGLFENVKERQTCELKGRKLPGHEVKSLRCNSAIQLEQDDQEGQEGQGNCNGVYHPGASQQLVFL